MVLSAAKYTYPSETSRHAATILGFPSTHSIASEYYETACFEIASLACAISEFEPVRLYTRTEDISKAQSKIKEADTKYTSNAANISIVPFPTNHLWTRDTGPVYVYSGEGAHKARYAINFRFSEWGRKDNIGDDDRATDGLEWPVMNQEQLQENASFASRVIESDTSPSPVNLVESKICLEGGALVVDGEGTLLATESSILNENRNPGLSRAEVEDELRRLLGVQKIIWFPGRRGLDVTDVHADAEVIFMRPGVIALSRPHSSAPKPWQEVYEEIRDILNENVDARGRRFEVHIVDEPDPKVFGELAYDEPATNYVNCYFVNGGLILPQFGDERRDREALDTFRGLCPDRVVRPVLVRGLPLAGGVIHCSTQPVLALDEH
ncbi:uncharacterized protein N7443_003238 [Penicillium atrosanguineum]|nr:uncharacterized protein N7443_003238 [Penicillium atrosanguineum]KAJ5118080.1 hypothetical protein N7526_011103 [Penicillium atrosanguineum]KAJ5310777.1 hypothetical protein N7443_003238 [Penicillium atrosanguineum]